MADKPITSLPCAIESERFVLGSLLLDPKSFPKVQKIINPSDFYRQNHQQIFSAMTSLYKCGSPIDLVTCARVLDYLGNLNDGGSKYLMDLLDRAYTSAGIEHHAKIVLQYSARREVVRTCQHGITQAMDPRGELPITMSEITDSLYGLMTDTTQGEPIHFGEVAQRGMKRLSEIMDRKNQIALPTGFTAIDSMLAGGFRSGDYAGIAARPSHGKSAIAMDMALNMSHHATCGKIGLLFSLEMDMAQIWFRVAAKESGVALQQIRSGNLVEREVAKITERAGYHDRLNLYVDDTSGLSPSDITARVEATCMKLKKQPAYIIVDYLGLMVADGRHASWSTTREVTELSRAMKAMPKRFDCPVIILIQLNRMIEQIADKTKRIPTAQYLRDSGALEQDLDILFGLMRMGVYEPNNEQWKNHAVIRLAKQRNGPVGQTQLHFRPEIATFLNPPLETRGDLI